MNRRRFIAGLAQLALCGSLPSLASSGASVKKRLIPVSGELLPIVGFGSSRVYDVLASEEKLKPIQDALSVLFGQGGSFVDTAHVYGRAEENIGRLLANGKLHQQAFLSTKVLATSKEMGLEQVSQSFTKLQTNQIDLLSVHNMQGLPEQLSLLNDLKGDGKVRYIGLSHYSDEGIDLLGELIEKQPVDFIQFRYSISNRHAEHRLLALAQEKGVAVVINQPFSKGMLFQKVRGKTVPQWAREWGADSWARFFLKFIVSHPSVNCVIPGTGNLQHALDNIGAGMGHIPSAKERQQMLDYWNTL